MAANKTGNESAAVKISFYDLIIGILAIFSLILLTLPLFLNLSTSTIEIINNTENLLCIIFIFDFLRNLYRAPRKKIYFINQGGWLDLLGSLPFTYLSAFRVFRLFRIIRVMRTLKGNDLKNLIIDQLARNVLLFTLCLAFLLIFIVSNLVLFAEKKAPNANILNYGDSFWWSIVTMTTVGYGDYYPVTFWGRAMAVILMFFGIGIIGVISSYLSTMFISLQNKKKTENANSKTKKRFT